jgi:hypothetical protein
MGALGRPEPFQSAPIFVGGDGRSGTTLLSLILDSNSELVVGPELHFRGPANLGASCVEACDLLINSDPRARNPELRNFPQIRGPVQFVRRCHRFGVSFDDLKRIINEQRACRGNELESFVDRCHLIEAIGQLKIAQTDKRRWGIKIMRDIGRPDRYAALWPNAQFIHIIRDGRDVAASQMREHGTWGYSDIEVAARAWVRLIENARSHSRGLSYMEIRYEDLVSDLERSVRAICEFAGVEFEPVMLDHSSAHHSLFENPYNHPSYKQAAQPVNSSAVGRYREDLSPEDIATFNEIVAAAALLEFAQPQR